MSKKRLTGTVVSDKMDKTLVVEVERKKEHPKYKRKYRVNKRYKAHCENAGFKIGDKVIIEECPPKSKDKKWTVIQEDLSLKENLDNSKT
jgi:small subunit ribosomal protein S17